MKYLRGCFGHFTSHAASYQRLDSADNAASGGGRDNPYNEPAPLAACRTGNIDWLKEEIEKDSSLVFRDYRSGKTGGMVSLLFMAAQEGHLEVAELLISHGADVNRMDDDRVPPLYIAAQSGHRDIVKCLLKEGADPKKKWIMLKIGKFAVLNKSPLAAARIDAKDQEIAGMIRKAIKEMKIDSANHQVQTTASGLSSYGTFNDMN